MEERGAGFLLSKGIPNMADNEKLGPLKAGNIRDRKLCLFLLKAPRPKKSDKGAAFLLILDRCFVGA